MLENGIECVFLQLNHVQHKCVFSLPKHDVVVIQSVNVVQWLSDSFFPYVFSEGRHGLPWCNTRSQ